MGLIGKRKHVVQSCTHHLFPNNLLSANARDTIKQLSLHEFFRSVSRDSMTKKLEIFSITLEYISVDIRSLEELAVILS